MNSDRIFLSIIALSVIAVVGVTAFQFLYQKHFDFFVEASCDPSVQTCFVRDCSNPDDCPENGLEVYQVFSLYESDFEKCSDSSCLKECTSGVLSCKPVLCNEEAGDSCTSSVSHE